MGVDFVRSRESHLTIAHDAVYRSIFKVIESESLAVGSGAYFSVQSDY